MTTMNAAVVTAFDQPPQYSEFPVPEARGADEQLAEVLAAGLHPRVRTGASGAHYTSSGTLPMVPGIDGVARRDDGSLVYFVADDDVVGTMADRAVVDARRSIPLPSDADVPLIAAAMNPAMSSWVALRKRVTLTPGSSVLVLGATGNAGTPAVQLAKRLGAGRVIAAGRSRARLDALADLGADELVQLTDDTDATARSLADAASEIDVAVDYLWGEPTSRAIMAILTAREDKGRALDWVEIGGMAGPTIELPSVALRSANFRLSGSGQGALSPRGFLAELPSLIDELLAGAVALSPRVIPLSDVERVWNEPDVPGERIVFVP